MSMINLSVEKSWKKIFCGKAKLLILWITLLITTKIGGFVVDKLLANEFSKFFLA
ncbi:hypothetical protein CHY_0154 [Carboxydothermus hydrogenoformans Z-2901]|uniref:Uncharacterized protein n=1 Tax=Carboxydothermus hydrogenoformans (strain ATCC BAA-161 / DSM 6008 / Z-2901) TaxID=246194 RepID=Q3AFQ8_CARHZ|nr:hypothetical protein CHY_0154 [Carboxydothermus hydrogenoformans Z-2901]